MIERVAILGVGLIGGSFGLALRKTGFRGEIVGVSSPAAIECGLKAGVISRAASFEEAARTADLIYLAQPVDRILETLARLGPLIRPGSLVTDAGSTKAAIASQAAHSLPEPSFLGGHPLAGKERRGAEAADADLFRDRPYVLCPSGSLRSPIEKEFRAWLARSGAKIIEMSAEEHDRTVAFTSHLPQLLSTALAATLAKQGDERLAEIFGTGLLDVTRLALSPPELWLSILATNKTDVTAALDAVVKVLLELRESLQTDTLETLFTTANRFAAALRNQ